MKHLRQLGVTSYSANGVSLTLAPEAPVVDDTPRALVEQVEAKRGRDGLLPEEQIELYGKLMG